MDLLARHEEFEMEVLHRMNSGRILEKMVFGGGTMLRLCHELNRYSADLDFWMIKTFHFEVFIGKLGVTLQAVLAHKFTRFACGLHACSDVNNPT